MKLISKYLETPICLSEEKVYSIQIKNKRQFNHFVHSIITYFFADSTSTDLMFWQEHEKINISDHCLFISDIAGFDPQDTKIQSLLAKKLLDDFKDKIDYVFKLEELLGQIQKMIFQELNEYDALFTAKNDLSFQAILKFMKMVNCNIKCIIFLRNLIISTI